MAFSEYQLRKSYSESLKIKRELSGSGTRRAKKFHPAWKSKRMRSDGSGHSEK